MVLLLPLLLLGVVLYLWITRRNSTLTRLCRWRLDRRLGPQRWQCATCGAVCTMPPGRAPKDCLRAGSGGTGAAPGKPEDEPPDHPRSDRDPPGPQRPAPERTTE